MNTAPAPQVVKEFKAAEILCVAVQTLRNWRHQRKGPPYLVVGKRGIRYEVDDLRSYIDTAILLSG